MNSKILLFIPMYNCEKQIIRVLEQIKPEILKYINEIIILNNKSTDNSENIAIQFCKQHPDINIKIFQNNENYGLGGSHKVAFHYAIENNFDYVTVLHGDAQGDISNILPYLENEEYKKYDCFLGSRFMKGSKREGYSKFRTFGNNVYNLLFSIAARKKIYDLGSGLNMYKTEILKSNFYKKFKDNLMFNYCMLLGSIYLKQKIRFFPITWSESDQVSNVKLFNQAITVLKILWLYIINKNEFMNKEFRDKQIKDYGAKLVFENINR